MSGPNFEDIYGVASLSPSSIIPPCKLMRRGRHAQAFTTYLEILYKYTTLPHITTSCKLSARSVLYHPGPDAAALRAWSPTPTQILAPGKGLKVQAVCWPDNSLPCQQSGKLHISSTVRSCFGTHVGSMQDYRTSGPSKCGSKGLRCRYNPMPPHARILRQVSEIFAPRSLATCMRDLKQNHGNTVSNLPAIHPRVLHLSHRTANAEPQAMTRTAFGIPA